MRVQRVNDDRGAVAVLVAILGVVLVGMLAFAVDLGNAYSVKRRLSTAADGASLAAAQELATRNAACGAGVAGADSTAARSVADDYSSTRNAPGSALQAGAAGFDLACPVPVGSGGLVTVRNSQLVDFTFGNLFGVANVLPKGVATARYGLLRTVTGLRPFGLCSNSVEVAALIASGAITSFDSRPTVRVTVDKTVAGACGTAGGNWGVLDFDGGSNPIGDIRDWTTNGYGKELNLIGDILAGDPGIPSGGSLQDAMNSIVGKTITLPTYDKVTANGNGADFHITGFVSATLCGWKFGNQTKPSSCSSLLPVGGASDPDFLELRFQESFSVGEFSNCTTNCPIHGVYGVALVPTP